MNDADRKYVFEIVNELGEVIGEIKDKAYRSDIEKQRELRNANKRFITGRHVKREINLLVKPTEALKEKLEAMLEKDFNDKMKEKEAEEKAKSEDKKEEEK